MRIKATDYIKKKTEINSKIKQQANDTLHTREKWVNDTLHLNGIVTIHDSFYQI